MPFNTKWKNWAYTPLLQRGEGRVKGHGLKMEVMTCGLNINIFNFKVGMEGPPSLLMVVANIIEPCRL